MKMKISTGNKIDIQQHHNEIAGFGPTLFAATVTPVSGADGPTITIEGGQDTVNNTELFTQAPAPSDDDQELYVHGF